MRTSTSSYRRINPRVETAVFITDDGKVLTETMAIGAWLETGETPAGSGACKGHIRLAEVIERFGS